MKLRTSFVSNSSSSSFILGINKEMCKKANVTEKWLLEAIMNASNDSYSGSMTEISMKEYNKHWEDDSKFFIKNEDNN